MKRALFSVGLIFLLAGILVLTNQLSAYARQGLFSGRAQGVVSVNVVNTTVDKIVAATKKVFISDGFKVESESLAKMVFERPARLGKDISYGGLANEGGTWERVEIIINDEGSGSFRLECNPYMVTDKGQGMFEDQSRVLKLFAGEYRRLMKQVVRETK